MYNKVQFVASDPAFNIYLSASAGTGKTKVLVDRVLRLLLAGTIPRNIICLTYTNAATEEMMERIQHILRTWSKMDTIDLTQDLEKLLGRYPEDRELEIAQLLHQKTLRPKDKIQISTLHSLCSSILNALHANKIQKQKEIIEEYKKAQIIKAIIVEILHDHQLQIKNYIDKIKDLYSFESLTEILYTLMMDNRRLLQYFALYERNRSYNDPSIIFVVQNFIEHITEQHNLIEQNIDSIKDFSRILEKLSIINSYEDINHSDLWYIKLELIELYCHIYFTEEYKPRQIPKSKIKGNLQLEQFWHNEQQYLTDFLNLLRNSRRSEIHQSLMYISKIALERYIAHKDKFNLYEYDDLLYETISTLQSSDNAFEILYKMDWAIDHILVDEAQDLSALQWQVIKLLSDEFFAGLGARSINRTIFIVGDFKQSIYSFQGAMPNEFIDIKDYFAIKVKGAGLIWHELEMNYSYRSVAKILETVDNTFLNIFSGIKVKHYAVRRGSGIVYKVPIIQGADSADNHRQIADTIADQIYKWIHNKRLIQAKNRVIAYDDIMILLRRRSSLMREISNSLIRNNIPINATKSQFFQKNLLTQDCIAIIKFIINPHNDLNLAGLSKSPFFMLSDDELCRICIERQERSLYEHLAIDQSQQALYNKLQLLLEESKKYTIYQFFFEIFCNKYIRYSKENVEAVELILKEAYLFSDQWGLGGWRTFLQIISKIDTQITSNNSQNGVNIMTVHASKGLQSPIIIIPDASHSEYKPFNQLIWHQDQPYLNFGKKINTSEINEIVKIYDQKNKEENLRLLYVALTRAEDELYLYGSHNPLIKNSWYNTINIESPNQIDP